MVGVTARAVDGAANDAVISAVADAFDVRRSAVRIAAGDRSRRKIIEIDIDEIDGRQRFAELLAPD